MLTSKQRSYLKNLSLRLTIQYQIGKLGLNDNSLKNFENALNAHELIKIDVLKGFDGDLVSLSNELHDNLECDIVSMVGRTIIIYRKKKKDPVIRLPK